LLRKSNVANVATLLGMVREHVRVCAQRNPIGLCTHATWFVFAWDELLVVLGRFLDEFLAYFAFEGHRIAIGADLDVVHDVD